MKSGEYSIALLTFFIGYVIFEAASGLLLKYFRKFFVFASPYRPSQADATGCPGPSRFIPAIILVWGSICIGMGFVTNVSSIVFILDSLSYLRLA